ncbi:MAG TPA: VOC family protein [Polyangiales bacterium]
MTRTTCIRLLCAIAALLVSPAQGRTSRDGGVQRVTMVVRELERARSFYCDLLGFTQVAELRLSGSPIEDLLALPGVRYRAATLRIGAERIVLQEPSRPGRDIARDARSDDGAFQHLALVVSDIDRMHAQLVARGTELISKRGPQTIPASNRDAGGIRALYFRDPDRHPLELIWYPPGRGAARWQRMQGKPVLGIDHTAIAVRDRARSEAFYRDVAGLVVRGRSFNQGDEQSALSAVDGARVHISGLGGPSGLGVELLEYETPGRSYPIDTHANDIWASEIELKVPSLQRALAAAASYGARDIRVGRLGARLRDPDGHALRLIEH